MDVYEKTMQISYKNISDKSPHYHEKKLAWNHDFNGLKHSIPINRKKVTFPLKMIQTHPYILYKPKWNENLGASINI